MITTIVQRRTSMVPVSICIIFCILSLCGQQGASAFTCDNKMVEETPTIAPNEDVTINGCTFTMLVTITNPGLVKIGGPLNTFKRGLKLVGGHNDDGGHTTSKAVTIENAYSPNAMTIEDVVFDAAEVSLRNVTFKQFILTDIKINGGSNNDITTSTTTFVAERLICATGMELRNVEVDATTMRFVDSHIAQPQVLYSPDAAAVYLSDAIFTNGAQLVFEDSVLLANYDVFQLWAASNNTASKYYFNMFRNGAMLNFTNVTATSKRVNLITSYNQGGSGVPWHRYGRFASGAKMVATNSRLSGLMQLYLVEGATVELDATSYDGASLSVAGDSEKNIVIPIPYTISVRSLSLAGCRVHLPDLNIPTPTTNTWDVRVGSTFRISGLQLANNQQLMIHAPEDSTTISSPSIILQHIHLSSSSSIVVEFHTMSNFVLRNSVILDRSQVVLHGCHVIRDVHVSGLNAQASSSLVVANSTADSTITVQDSHFSGNSFVMLENTTTHGSVTFGPNLVFSTNSSLLIHGSAMTSVDKQNAALRLYYTLFTSSSLCLQDTELVGARYGKSLEMEGSSTKVDDDSFSFINGSRIVMSNVLGRLANGKVAVVAGNALSRTAPSNIRETTVVLHNNTFLDGRFQLHTHGNRTRVFIDSSMLFQSNLDLISPSPLQDDESNDNGGREVVEYMLPPLFTVRTFLRIQGGIVRFCSSSSSNGGGNSDDSEMTPAEVAAIIVQGELYLKQPMNLTIANGQQLRLQGAPGGGTTYQRVQIQPLIVSSGSTILVHNFDNAGKIDVSSALVEDNSSIQIRNITLVDGVNTSPLVVDHIRLLRNSGFHLVNVTATKKSSSGHVPMKIQYIQCDASVILCRNVTTFTGLKVVSSSFANGGQLLIDAAKVSATHHDLAAFHVHSTTFSSDSLLQVQDSVFSKKVERVETAPAPRCLAFTDATSLLPGSLGVVTNVEFVVADKSSTILLEMMPAPTSTKFTSETSTISSTLLLENMKVSLDPDLPASTEATMVLVMSKGTVLFSGASFSVETTAISVVGEDSSQIGCAAALDGICTNVEMLPGNSDTTIMDKDKFSSALQEATATSRMPNWNLVNSLMWSAAEEKNLDAIISAEFDEVVRNLTDCRVASPPFVPPPQPEPSLGPRTSTVTAAQKKDSLTISSTSFKPNSPSHSLSMSPSGLPLVSEVVATATLPPPLPTDTVVPSSSPVSVTTPQPTQFVPINDTEAPTTATPETTPPPTTRPAVKVTTILGGETEGRVVTSTAGATSMVGASLGSGSGGVVAAISAVKLASCGIAQDGDRPEYFELPIQFPIGTSPLRWFIGAVLAHAILNTAVFVVLVSLRKVSRSHRTAGRRQRRRWRQLVRFVSMLFTGLHTFFTPNIIGACATLIVHDAGFLGRIVGCFSAGMTVVVCAVVGVAIQSGPRNGVQAKHDKNEQKGFALQKRTFVAPGYSTITSSSSSSRTKTSTTTSSSSDSTSEEDTFDDNESISSTSSTSTINSSDAAVSPENAQKLALWRQWQEVKQEHEKKWLFSGPAILEALLPLFEGCREFERSIHRNYTTVEVTLASTIAAIAGARPDDHCQYAAFSTCLIAVIGIGYAIGVRPYRTYLDTIFNVANYSALVVLCVAVAVLSSQNSSSNNIDTPSKTQERSESAMVASLWLISSGAYVHLVIQVVWGIHVQRRRQRRLEKADDDDELGQPLLTTSTNGGEDDVELQEKHTRQRLVAPTKTYEFALPSDEVMNSSFSSSSTSASAAAAAAEYSRGDNDDGDEMEGSIVVNPLGPNA